MSEEVITPVTPEEDVPVAEGRTSYTDWVKQVVENLLEAEKKWIELASEQNALTMKAIRQSLEFYRTAPTRPLGNWARQGMDGFLEAQRKWFDSAAQQRNQLFQQAQEAGVETAPTTEEPVAPGTATVKPVTDYVRQQVEGLVEARKRWLDFLTQQNAQALRSMQEALGLKESVPATNIAKWSQQTMEGYVDVQKRWLDFITRTPAPPAAEVQEEPKEVVV